MTNPPLDEMDSHPSDNCEPSSNIHKKKPSKIRNIFGSSISKSNSKEGKPTATNPSIAPSTVQYKPRAANRPRLGDGIFPDNIVNPAIKSDLPRLHQRIERTEQLIRCNTLLLQNSLTSGTTESTLDKAELVWLEEIKNDPIEQDHMRWLVTRMVEAFLTSVTNDSTELAEVVALGPVLQKEAYRKLLTSLIKDFDDARILDDYVLQGLAQLVQDATPNFLEPDDLIKILSILRVRLQGTHGQSTAHSYHLTLAVSKVLDVMAEHKVQDLSRVLEHEPLSGVLSGLTGSSDPYLMYQACYAFQALQYVPDNETALQGVLRHSAGVVDGLVKVSSLFTLDVASVLEGLDSLKESIGGVVSVASTVYEGVSSLMESGQGVLDSLKKGFSSGKKRPWYAATKAAYALAQAGQLKDLKQLILEAPCRRDPLFQWGICQLLGEIAVDPVWTVVTRQQAISFLGYLYKDDQDWGGDESVKTWMLTIVAKLSATLDPAVNAAALALLQDLDQDTSTIAGHLYPLMSRLPIPASSPILAKVQNIPYVEYDIHKLRLQRLNETKLAVYIPPMAKANPQARDEDLFALMDKVQEFLGSNRQVMLILGDSGSGKSTFNTHLESELLRSYTRGGRIPLFINLPAIDEPQQDMIEKQLKTYNFNDAQIQELKLSREFVLICDGYDESQQLVNLHRTNSLNQSAQWNTKMVITCRTQYLGQDYHSRFAPTGRNHYARPALELFQEAIVQYIEQYVPLEPRTWTTQDYMDKLTTIPNLMDLVKNPFVLTLALEALPLVIEGKQELSAIKITRVQLYDTFVGHWLDVNKRRLEGMALSDEDRGMLDQLLDADFVSMGTEYSTNLASAIFEHQDGNPVVRYVHLKDKATWRAEFFRPDPEVRLLRESSPLTRTGSLFRFLHRSMQEYFYSRTVFDPSIYGDDDEFYSQSSSRSTNAQPLDPLGTLFKRDLLKEPSVIQFLCERVKQYPNFQKQLLAVIEYSKLDPSAARGATNAMTILVRAGIRFNSADLRGIRVPGADLADGQFDSAQLQGADLRGANFARSWLRQVDFGGAQMDGVRFGEMPYLEEGSIIHVTAYSPDGKLLAVGLDSGAFDVFDTATWTKVLQKSVHKGGVLSLVFSPNSQYLVSGSSDNTLRLWDVKSGETLSVMEGHSEWVSSVAFSPCGKHIASASNDMTVRLWSTETGENIFIMEGHTSWVSWAEYSPDGQSLFSSSWDGTIRKWDPKSGKADASWTTPDAKATQVAYSRDGRWFAFITGPKYDKIQLLNALTGELGPVLDDSRRISSLAFSPNGQWIITFGVDYTIRLLDSSTGLLISSLSGHTKEIRAYTFSPNSQQIASGDIAGVVRLWEVNASRSPIESQRVRISVWGVAYTPDGRFILTGGSRRDMEWWDSATGNSGSIPAEMADDFYSFKYSGDGQQVALGYHDGTILFRSLQGHGTERILSGHIGTVTKMFYSPCGRWLLSSSWDKTARLWDLHDTHGGSEIVGQTSSVFDKLEFSAFSPVGDRFVLGTTEGSVRVFDTLSTHPRRPVKELSFKAKVHSLDYSPDGQRIALGISQPVLYLWDPQSNRPTIELKGHTDNVRCVAYSQCGRWILSGSADKTVRVWHLQPGEVEDWRCAAVVQGFSGGVYCLAWNPATPTEFVTGCQDGSVRAWKISSKDRGGDVSVYLVWGVDVGRLTASGLTFKSTVGLSLINQRLLIQRGAVDDGLLSS
ncbi:U3 snoRNP protein [Mortierella sp. 14UC]|nr:U3 snoRNP protein [Mortierella sp. 14UC]